MKYRQDDDLDFLGECTNEELTILVEVLLYNREGEKRTIVQLSHHPLYQKYAPNHSAYWEVIAGEVQRYGSNPLAALARAGRGKHYAKIVSNVCSRFDIPYNPDGSTDFAERTLCIELLSRAMQNISSTELQSIITAFALKPERSTAGDIAEALHTAICTSKNTAQTVFMIAAHAAAIYASNKGYLDWAPPALIPILRFLEKPLAQEFSTVSPVSLTGAAHWIVIPVVFQVAWLRAMHQLR